MTSVAVKSLKEIGIPASHTVKMMELESHSLFHLEILMLRSCLLIVDGLAKRRPSWVFLKNRSEVEYRTGG